MKTENETKGVIKYSVESVKDGKTTYREEIIFNCLPSFILRSFVVLLVKVSSADIPQFQLTQLLFSALLSVQPLSNCYIFPYSVAGGLKFGSEIIYLILSRISNGFRVFTLVASREISFSAKTFFSAEYPITTIRIKHQPNLLQPSDVFN